MSYNIKTFENNEVLNTLIHHPFEPNYVKDPYI